MMHKDGMHRVLNVFAFRDVNEFFASPNIPNEPCYIILPNPFNPNLVQLHGYHVLTDDAKPCMLDSDVIVDEFITHVMMDEVDRPYPELTTAYITSGNQIYQKVNGVWTKGFVFIKDDQIMVFADYIKCDLKIYENVDALVNAKFESVNFDTLSGVLKPDLVPEVCYVKETEMLYCHIDSKNLNVVARDVKYQTSWWDEMENKPDCWVSKSKHLFIKDRKVTNFDFDYDDCKVKIVLQ